MAWTERYVRADAAGGGDGTTDTNSGANGAWTLAEAVSNYASGQRVNIKAGSYSATGGLTLSTDGSTTAPVWFRGFKTTIGDMDTADHGTFMGGAETPAIDLGSNRWITSGAYVFCSNLDMQSSTASNSVFRYSGEATYLIRCRIEGTASSVNGRAVSGTTNSDCFISECWLKATPSADCASLTDRSSVINSWFEGGKVGLEMAVGTLADSNVFNSQASHAITTPSGARISISNNVIYGSGGDGIRFVGTPNLVVIKNNIIVNVGGYGINNASGTNTAKAQRIRNAFLNITSGQEDGFGDWAAVNPITLSADPFVDAAGGDFNINNTAGGGAELRAATVVLP